MGHFFVKRQHYLWFSITLTVFLISLLNIELITTKAKTKIVVIINILMDKKDEMIRKLSIETTRFTK